MSSDTKSNFILTLKLKTEKFQEDILNKRLEISRQMYNSCLGELFKRYKYMKQSKEYIKVVRMNKGKDRNKRFSELNKKYGLTEYSLHDFIKPMQHKFKKNIDSFTAQKIATRCFSAFEELMFHKANRVYFKRYDEMNSVEGKSNKTGIRFVDNKLEWNKLSIPVIIKKNDEYAQMALQNKVKYCRVVRKFIRGKYKFYLQLIIDGVPPIKVNKDSSQANDSIETGDVGIDIGTQTIAIASKYDVKLLELAPEINNIEKEKRILQRKLDRQRRANNPDKYNDNGTINRGNRDKWIKSNRYVKTQNELREIQRKQADIRKKSHEKLANYIVGLGSKIKVETMKFKGLQARAKETTVNEKTGRVNKKKRFGKSLANKAPAMLLTILDNKLKWNNEVLIVVNTYKVRASQYSHIEDKYTKKTLSERWNDFSSYKIQRDMYSAFLIMNVKDDLKEIDRDLCFRRFENFRKLHDKEIERIKNSENKSISSMGL
ncbi:hypothetical protein Curi_c25870 [Gottschalkia acidurici 9a]|uniref:Transposase n=1 Tax=Gottschalkia acidurici (strain ATCC 7906 / DSM 604 / BCRC 14475 / CIP 104303 / KCTC 5404 / NCIMB 10678 / 9a) TaxID=1128398 RepID=K0B323_GOTA9|nr:hypothetical protein [Gottschalkia acidurici]AFS79582.1 hypothetical protein Curi_c25870 [Gottschalkia acidurici 9a]